jgi:enoyl-CoA hydratase/carnithine racemase
MAKEENMTLFRIEDGVGIITFNRPHKLNAISWEQAGEIADLLREIRFNDDVRCVLIHGANGAFSTGGDVDFLSGDSDRPMPGTSDPSRPIPRSQRKYPGGTYFDVARQLLAVDKPVIAAIEGPAVGAGLAYACACDRRFGDSTVKMSAIFTNVGLAPDCGMSYFLPKIVGLSNALMMVETAKIFKGEECVKLGLIDEYVENGKVFESALAYAKSIACRASVAVDMARRMIHMSVQGATLEEILDYEGVAGVVVASSFDAKEGTTAFLQKRKPQYRGI